MARRPRRDQSDPATWIRFEHLPRRDQRRKVVPSFVRSLAVGAVIMAIYFSLPLTHPGERRSILVFVAGIVAIAVALGVQIRATMRSPYPRLRALETLGTIRPLFLILFAATHYLIEHNNVHSYSQAMTRLDVLYYIARGRCGCATGRSRCAGGRCGWATGRCAG